MKKTISLLIIWSVILLFACKDKDAEAGETEKAVLIAKADSLVTITFDTLRNTLLKAIGEKNYDGAVAFCNAAAVPLTNTYTASGIAIRRTSDKYRNSANAPDSMEQRILAAFHEMKNKQKPIKPVFEEDQQGNYHYFKPILMQAMCLNCHGSKDAQIQPATWQSIQQKYPADMAYGYKEGDLRGAWHVMLSKK